MKYVIVSGGFDPIHSGHIELLKKASSLGDKLIVGVNSDAWLIRKKGRAFMPLQERKNILESIKWVDEVWEFDDSDNSACKLIEDVIEHTLRHSNIFDLPEFIFANGGDRTEVNIPEMKMDGVNFVFGVGGTDKKNSSSSILKEWKSPKTEREWGFYRVLYEIPGVKVKELTVDPKKTLSMQRHHKRNEYWFVASGNCDVHSMLSGDFSMFTKTLREKDYYFVPIREWHRLSNPYSQPCKIIEIQYGEECIEDDIERK